MARPAALSTVPSRKQVITMSRELLLASLGARKNTVSDVITRAEAMSTGFGGHASDYPALSPPLGAFQTLLANLVSAQQLVPNRTVGAAKARNVQRDLLWTAMKSECAYVQSLVESAPTRGLSLIQNAGLVVVSRTLYTKPILALTLGAQPGTVNCNANLGLLVGVGTTKPNQKRCLNWQYTLHYMLVDGIGVLCTMNQGGSRTGRSVVGGSVRRFLGRFSAAPLAASTAATSTLAWQERAGLGRVGEQVVRERGERDTEARAQHLRRAQIDLGRGEAGMAGALPDLERVVPANARPRDAGGPQVVEA
jgi:hypothetical protein